MNSSNRIENKIEIKAYIRRVYIYIYKCWEKEEKKNVQTFATCVCVSVCLFGLQFERSRTKKKTNLEKKRRHFTFEHLTHIPLTDKRLFSLIDSDKIFTSFLCLLVSLSVCVCVCVLRW